MSLEIYHNPRCSKSRETLKLLEARGLQAKVRLYLENPPSRKELEALLKTLGVTAQTLTRTQEKTYKELVKQHGVPSETQLVDWMLEYPVLIERPIVINGKQARVGRPPEQVLEIL